MNKMQIVVQGQAEVTRFWEGTRHQNLSYRLMRYSVTERCDDGWLLLNTVTGELVLVSDENEKWFCNLPSPYTPEMDDLIEHRFLVPIDFDENKSVNQLRNILQKFHSTKGIITNYSIIPTTGCNARCFYCYESGFPHHTMTSEIVEKTISFIEGHCGSKRKVLLHWFGGEPTICDSIIDRICDGLMEKQISFTSAMISNGYLFTEEMVLRAKNKWKLRKVQITLDGTEEVYNKTKAYVNVKESAYRRVIKNISLLLDAGIAVSVRMNLGFYNAEDIGSLIDELMGAFVEKKDFSAYVHELFEDKGFIPVSHTDDERRSLIDIKRKLNKRIVDNGCNCPEVLTKKSPLPRVKLYHCMADNPSTVFVNPLGQFGKCEHLIYSDLIGSLEEGIDDVSETYVQWHNPQYDRLCRSCSLYPYCGRIQTCEAAGKCYEEQVNDKILTIRNNILSLYIDKKNAYFSTKEDDDNAKACV